MNLTVEYKKPMDVLHIKTRWTGEEQFKVVSLFAGGGGSSTGYRMAGGKVLGVSEFIPEAQRTYHSNWPDTHIFKQDVRELKGNDILEILGLKEGELDILDGSPPCSAFSTSGKRDKGWGKDKKYSDSSQKNVEDLFFEYIRILRDVKPKVMIAENVSGLVKGSAKGYFNEIMRELRSSGYHVECKVLDAKWLGVPQGRQRTIFVGVRNDLYKPEMKLHPKPFGPLIPLKKAFEGINNTVEELKEVDISKYEVYKLLVELKNGQTHKKRFNLVKSSPIIPSQCITAKTSCLSAAAPRHWENRAFTVKEIKRIMSVPDDYKLTGTYKQQVERLGRMVPPVMMANIARNVYMEVLGGNSKIMDV